MRRSYCVRAMNVGSEQLGLIEAIKGEGGVNRLVVRAIAGLLVAIAAVTLVGRADAFVYWTETTLGATGRANNVDGSGANTTFISGLNNPKAMVIDGTYIYWVTGLGNIGRANLNGTGVNESFIVGPHAEGLAIDGTYIYWSTSGPNGSHIGRASLNGTGINPTFIATTVAATGVAVDGTFIYWTNSAINAIGRANVLDGSAPNQLWITNAENPQGLAVDAAHIYWAAANSGTIARADLNGQGVNQSFVFGAKPESVVVDSTHVWWTNGSPLYSIGRADLVGSNVNQRFINTLSVPAGLAVNALVAPFPGPGPAPPPTITLMVADVQGLGLPRGIERGLLAKLGAAQGNIDAGHLQAACGSLGAYVHEVRAQTGRRFDSDQAANLIADATAIRQLLGCGAD